MADQDHSKFNSGTAGNEKAGDQQTNNKSESAGQQESGQDTSGQRTSEKSADEQQSSGQKKSAARKKEKPGRKKKAAASSEQKAARRSRRKRTGRRAIIVIINVLIIVIFWYLVRNLFLPIRAYHQAEQLVTNHQYAEAEEAFAAIADRYDLAGSDNDASAEPGGSGSEASSESSSDHSGNGNTASFTDKAGNALRSLNRSLSRLGGFDDAESRVTETRYQEAVYLRSQESWEEAVNIFEELGDYGDSSDQIQETRIAWASSLTDSGEYDQAITLLKEIGSYDSPDYGSAQTLLDRTRYTLAGKLADIGKLDEAESLYSDSETYQDAYEKLRDLRYNMARNALLLSDFDSAKALLTEVGDYKDSKDILAILDTAVDRVYVTDYADISGSSTGVIKSCIWMHSMIVPGRLEEGISVRMQEDIMTGGVLNTGIFGAASYDYNLEQVRDADTWYFTYYGSDTEDSGGAVVLQADFGPNYSTMTTKKVYVSTRNAEEEADAEAAAEAAKVAQAEDDTSSESVSQAEEGDEESGTLEDESDTQNSSDSGSGSSDERSSSSDSSDERDSSSDSSDEKGSSSDNSADKTDSSDTSSDNSDETDSSDDQKKDEPAKLEFEQERSWTEVTDTTLANEIKEGFRTRRKVQLAENGNMYFYNATDDERLPHYCSVEHCLNTGTYKAADMTGRRYYCEDHYEEYTKDTAYRTEDDPKVNDTKPADDAASDISTTDSTAEQGE